MIDPVDFRDVIVTPALNVIELNSAPALELLLGTAFVESGLTRLSTVTRPDGLGLFQMTAATHDVTWEALLDHPELASKVSGLTRWPGHAGEMVGNLWYATAMARVFYRSVAEPLPEGGDVSGMAAYWKEHYDTPFGPGTEEEYIDTWYATVGSDGVL